jgi:hypothetical protein
MLKAENTPNNTGVIISGTFDDLDSLYDALSLLASPFSDENAESSLYDTAMHVMGICYDIRHAYMGDRELKLVDNNISTEAMKYHGIICPSQNVEYGYQTIWLEALFVVSALNVFIDHRARIMVKTRYLYRLSDHHQVMFDKAIAVARNFQAVIMEALHDLVGDNVYARTAKMIAAAPEYVFDHFCSDYLNMLTVKYLRFDPEKKKKNLSVFIKRVLEQGQEYMEIRESITAYAKENGCDVRDVRLKDTEFPEEIEW